MKAGLLGGIVAGVRAAGVRLRRLAVRGAVRTGGAALVRLILERVPGREARRLHALLTGILYLDRDWNADDVDVTAAAAAALAWLSRGTPAGDRFAGRLARKAVERCQQGIGPEGYRPISRRSRPAFLEDPARGFADWRASGLYRLRCATMRRRAARKQRQGRVRGGPRRRVLFVAYRQWQFMRDLVPAFRDDPDLEVRTLEFAQVEEAFAERPSLFAESSRDEPAGGDGRGSCPNSRAGRLMAWADVVFVEWCDYAAVWMSHRLPRDKRLVVRLHSFEAFSPSPHLVDWANVDVLIFVGEHIQRFLLEQIDPREFGTKLAVLPGVMRLERYCRAKLPSARRVLGLVKFASATKDPLLAARILKRLRRHDTAWRLLLVGECWTAGERTGEEAEARLAFERYAGEEGLQEAMEWQPFTPAIEEVLPRIGFILSTSEREGCPSAVAEGMASGCVPMVRRWPLVKPWVTTWLHDEAWLFDTADEAAARILDCERSFEFHAQRAQEEAFAKWDRPVVMPALRKLVLG